MADSRSAGSSGPIVAFRRIGVLMPYTKDTRNISNA